MSANTWVAIIIIGTLIFIAAAFVWILATPVDRPKYVIQWEQIGQREYRACDPSNGNLLYKEVNSAVAGDHITVVVGGCK